MQRPPEPRPHRLERDARRRRALSRRPPEPRPHPARPPRIAPSTHYDVVLLDCSPSLSLMNQNALVFADGILVPVACDFLSLVGVRQVIKTVKNVNALLHHPVQIYGVLPTFYDARARICRDAVDALEGALRRSVHAARFARRRASRRRRRRARRSSSTRRSRTRPRTTARRRLARRWAGDDDPGRSRDAVGAKDRGARHGQRDERRHRARHGARARRGRGARRALGRFYAPDARRAARRRRARRAAEKPAHYKVICISMYTKDLDASTRSSTS